MTLRKSIGCAALASFVFGVPTSAQTPLGTAFIYQGQLKSGGSPANGSFNMIFKLWNHPTLSAPANQVGPTLTFDGAGGNPPPVTIASGLFTLQLDFGANAINGTARWLEITVSGTTLSPRQPLTPAPHALALPGLHTLQLRNSPSLIGGYAGNLINSEGANIAGGGNSTSPNLITDSSYASIGGGAGNSASGGGGFNVIGGGEDNIVSGYDGCTVAGGLGNTASGRYSSVGGGTNNTASGFDSIIAGGSGHLAIGNEATISGGGSNNAGDYASIGGGVNNTAGSASTVAGGFGNSASANFATIAGGGIIDNTLGTGNRVTDDYGTIGGGGNNQAGDNAGTSTDSPCATVAGGSGNTAKNFGAVGGGELNTALDSAFVGGGVQNIASGEDSVVGGGLYNAANGYADTIAGGQGNNASGSRGTIGGGVGNGTGGEFSTVAGGAVNLAIDGGTVGGGFGNQATNIQATVGGGLENIASGENSTVGGGENNEATGGTSVVGGGSTNIASGFDSTVPGGVLNQAGGYYSLAAGRRAKVRTPAQVGGGDVDGDQGTFIWADSTNADFTSSGPNKFLIRASGGTIIYSNAALTAGVTLAAGGGSWSSVSDRNAKDNFKAVDSRAVLDRVSELSIATWNYKSQDPGIRHIGPIAQDFKAAFGVGEDDRRITTIDADGVALAAIQGLHQIVNERESQITMLRQDNAELRARLKALEVAVEKLTQSQNGGVR